MSGCSKTRLKIEKVVFRLLPCTSFVYEKPGLKLVNGSNRARAAEHQLIPFLFVLKCAASIEQFHLLFRILPAAWTYNMFIGWPFPSSPSLNKNSPDCYEPGESFSYLINRFLYFTQAPLPSTLYPSGVVVFTAIFPSWFR